MSKRVLVISAAIGGGHVAAAKALERSFLAQGAQVKHVDLLDYTAAPFRRLYRQAYFDLVRTAPEFVDWLGSRLDRHPSEQLSRQGRLRARATRLISYHLPRLIKRYKPDVIVHTHFLAPEILSTTLLPHLLRRGAQRIPQFVVITDYFAHSLWLEAHIEKYFVATQEVAVHLKALGIEESRIVVSGIPVDLSFAQLPSKQVARKALGYPEDKDLVLINASGLNFKTLEPLVKQLKEFKWPLSAVIVCGRSANLANDLRLLCGDAEGLVHFDIKGFTQEMPSLMAAADLLVGKPGGLTTSEALAAGLPFAIVQPYPLQEEANTSFLLEHGAAFRIEPLTTFSYKLKLFFENPELRMQRCVAAKSLGRPLASQTVAEIVLGTAKT